MYEIHDDFTAIERAKKWCLVDAIGTGSATKIAKVLLSKHHCAMFPLVIDLQALIGTLDTRRLQLAIGVILYSDELFLECSEMEELRDLYLDE